MDREQLPSSPGSVSRIVRMGRLLCLATLLGPAVAQAQDDVVHRRSGIVVRGTIVAQDETGVRMIFGAGKEPKLIPAAEIERIEVKLKPEHEQAQQLLERKDFARAAELLETALANETRPWLRGRLAADLVRCHLATGDCPAAIDTFLRAAQSEPMSVPWGMLPAWWLPDAPPAAAVTHAATLLRDASPLRQLIGASYLATSSQTAAAHETLRRLAAAPDEPLASLARAQLWRTRITEASADELAGWESQLGRLPPELRGGPSFLLALGCQAAGRHEEAALHFLRPALVHRSDQLLSRRALLLAAQSLEQTGDRASAGQLYQELVTEFPAAAEATTARLRLRTLKE